MNLDLAYVNKQFESDYLSGFVAWTTLDLAYADLTTLDIFFILFSNRISNSISHMRLSGASGIKESPVAGTTLDLAYADRV